jgi:hypothetical protein
MGRIPYGMEVVADKDFIDDNGILIKKGEKFLAIGTKRHNIVESKR